MTIKAWFLSHQWLLDTPGFPKGSRKAGWQQRRLRFGRSCWEPGAPSWHLQLKLEPQSGHGGSRCHCQAQLGQQETSSSQSSPLLPFQKDISTSTWDYNELEFFSQTCFVTSLRHSCHQKKTMKRMNLLCNSGQLDSSSAAIAEFSHDLEPTQFFSDAHRSGAVHFVCPAWSCQVKLPARWVLEPRAE